jgi:EAL domain-containing protein (putative c-di-GMP-specific phosphodiesterase class I)
MGLNGLRSQGVRIAIDDLDPGYSSPGHLQELPVDIVKIDGSFIKGIEVDSVSEAIVLAGAKTPAFPLPDYSSEAPAE